MKKDCKKKLESNFYNILSAIADCPMEYTINSDSEIKRRKFEFWPLVKLFRDKSIKSISIRVYCFDGYHFVTLKRDDFNSVIKELIEKFYPQLLEDKFVLISNVYKTYIDPDMPDWWDLIYEKVGTREDVFDMSGADYIDRIFFVYKHRQDDTFYVNGIPFNFVTVEGNSLDGIISRYYQIVDSKADEDLIEYAGYIE